ncbi:MAG: tetraacyldisaccharide 4'-kinase [Draconibacterium sp.]|nr:MAG: tetraacyldisaccharide 4'-kinase [Draconibacterium sp.]
MKNFIFYPLSWIYGFGVALRNRAYSLNLFKSREFEVPVISVGNITVGGTGKTPHVEYLVQLLRKQFNVATLSRGYKRKTTGFIAVETTSSVNEVGDEPVQIKQKFPNQSVAVCENRVEGVKKLLNANPDKAPDVVILDDAFQHRRITPGINIVLIDYNRQIKDDHLLPLGRLRESPSQIRRANVIIFTKCPPNEVTPIMRRILQKDVHLLPYQSLFFSALEYDKLVPVFKGRLNKKLFYTDKVYSAVVVTGIANPSPVKEHISTFTKQTEMLVFPDHHYFSENDIEQIMQKFEHLNAERKVIITTEKDAVRMRDRDDLPASFKAALFYLPVKVKFLENEEKVFSEKILKYVGENKSNRELHQRKNKSNS